MVLLHIDRLRNMFIIANLSRTMLPVEQMIFDLLRSVLGALFEPHGPQPKSRKAPIPKSPSLEAGFE